MSFISTYEEIILPAGGSKTIEPQVDSIFIDYASQAVIGLRVNSGALNKVPAKTLLKSTQFENGIKKIKFENQSQTSDLRLGYFLVTGGEVGTNDMKLSGAVVVSSGVTASTTKHAVTNANAVRILNEDLNRTTALLRVLNGKIFIATSEAQATSAEGFPVGANESIELDTSAEYWAIAESSDADVRILLGAS